MKRFWIVWLVWIVVAVLGGFIMFESYALVYGKITLSRSVWEISYNFPPFPFFCGIVVGFLACHFWWDGFSAFKREKEHEKPSS
jgi:cytochrome b subunit of formate dehydrogenase